MYLLWFGQMGDGPTMLEKPEKIYHGRLVFAEIFSKFSHFFLFTKCIHKHLQGCFIWWTPGSGQPEFRNFSKKHASLEAELTAFPNACCLFLSAKVVSTALGRQKKMNTVQLHLPCDRSKVRRVIQPYTHPCRPAMVRANTNATDSPPKWAQSGSGQAAGLESQTGASGQGHIAVGGLPHLVEDMLAGHEQVAEGRVEPTLPDSGQQTRRSACSSPSHMQVTHRSQGSHTGHTQNTWVNKYKG